MKFRFGRFHLEFRIALVSQTSHARESRRFCGPRVKQKHFAERFAVWHPRLPHNTMKTRLVAFIIGLALLPIGALLVTWLGWWPTRATASPPTWARAFAQAALRSSVAKRARGITNPIPVSDETLLAGMKIYRMNCAGCHGDLGQPSHWGTTGFYPRVPQFADAPSRLSPPEMFFVIKN